jgi:hypothetical protein
MVRDRFPGLDCLGRCPFGGTLARGPATVMISYSPAHAGVPIL